MSCVVGLDFFFGGVGVCWLISMDSLTIQGLPFLLSEARDLDIRLMTAEFLIDNFSELPSISFCTHPVGIRSTLYC